MASGTAAPPLLCVENHLGASGSTLARDVLVGMHKPLKELPPKHLYDPVGVDLFERICSLPEYYPTRAERMILEWQADRLAALCGVEEVVELGAGSARKSELLLAALLRAGTLRRYLPVDISAKAVRSTVLRLASRLPGIELHGVVADLEHHLPLLPAPSGRRAVLFLGSTIGNLKPAARRAFLAQAAALVGPEGFLVVGFDLLKDRRTLLAAYNDRQGVTAAFNLNLLDVLNRELRADFDRNRFCHVARFDGERGWVEMRLRSKADQEVRFAALGLRVRFELGEEIRTEISAKFRRSQVEAELCRCGLELRSWLTDPRRRFAIAVAASQ